MNITVFTAIITALVMVLVAIITWREWQTNRARLRHELFDRRYATYEKITGFIAEILTSGGVPRGEPEGFLRRTKTAYFVFACDDDVKGLIKDIYEQAVKLHELEATFDSLTGNERKENVKEQREVKNWFAETLGSLETIFGNYLKLID